MKSYIHIFEHQPGVIKFTEEATGDDFLLPFCEDEIREFTNVESPCDMVEVEGWLSKGGFVPEVVLDFIAHSRGKWQMLMEVENAN